MKLTRILDSELPPQVQAIVHEMIEANRDDVALFQRSFGPTARAAATAHDATVVATEPPAPAAESGDAVTSKAQAAITQRTPRGMAPTEAPRQPGR